MARNDPVKVSATNSNRTPTSAMIEDLLSPFFSHRFDHQGLALVSQPLTNENNNTRSRSMTIALKAKNKLGFIDGTIK